MLKQLFIKVSFACLFVITTQGDELPSVQNAVQKVLPELTEPDMQKKMPLHYELAAYGEKVVPELEKYLPTVNDQTLASIMWVLMQVGRDHHDLVGTFIDKIHSDNLRLAGVYLDVVQDILQPKGTRMSYWYSAREGTLTRDEVEKAKEFWKTQYAKHKPDNEAVEPTRTPASGPAARTAPHPSD